METQDDPRPNHPSSHLNSWLLPTSFCFFVLTLFILFFACSKYYTNPSDGFADQFGGLIGNAILVGIVFFIACFIGPRREKKFGIFLFLIAMSIITLYKSVTLLREASSVKNMTNKFSSILDDLKSGKNVSNENIDMTQFGKMSEFVAIMNNFIHNIQIDTENLYTELEACNYSSISDAEKLLQGILSSQCSFDFEKSEIVLKKAEDTIKSRCKDFETKINNSNLPTEIKHRALSNFKKDDITASFRLLRSYICEIRLFLTFMKENKSDWTYKNKQFVFQSPANTAIFKIHANNYQRLIGEFAESEKQFEIDLKQKQKEITELAK